jgi:hypothetical protein
MPPEDDGPVSGPVSRQPERLRAGFSGNTLWSTRERHAKAVLKDKFALRRMALSGLAALAVRPSADRYHFDRS